MTLRPSMRQPVRCDVPSRSRRATLSLLLATAWLGSATGVQAQTAAPPQPSAVTGGFGSNSGHMNTSNWYDDRWYLSALVGYVWTDSSRQAGNGVPYGFAVGKPINPNWNLELRGLYEKLDGQADGPGNYRNWTASVDAQWFFMGRTGSDRWNAIQPYAVAGVGLINDKNQVKSGTSLMAHGGIGATWAFSRWGRLVVDGRYRFDDNRDKVNRGRNDNFNEWIVTFGLQIPLGPVPELSAPSRTAVIAPAPMPIAPPVVVTPPAPRTVAPAPAVAAPVTRTVDISADGMFGFDRSDLSDTGRSRIEQTISGLRQSGMGELSSVRIVGHTDPLGSDAYNLKLSAARAESVKSHMTTLGVPAAVISASGAGESQLKVTEAECRTKGEAANRDALIRCLAPNRRVEITATGSPSR